MAEPFYPACSPKSLDTPKFRSIVARSPQHLRKFILKSFPIGDLITSPGHAWLEPDSPAQRQGFITQPILINLRAVKLSSGRIKVECAEIWDGHHRLLSSMLACGGPDTTLEQSLSWIASSLNLPEDVVDPTLSLVILLNGVHPNGTAYEQWIKLSGLIVHYRWCKALATVPGFMASPYSVKWISNLPRPSHECKLSAARFYPQTSAETRLGLYYGSFDPFHNGHLDIIKYLLENDVVNKVIVVPNAEAANKSFKASQWHRVAMLKISLEGLMSSYPRRIFIYLRNNSWNGSMSLRSPFVEGIGQWFGVRNDNVFHIEGIEDNKPFMGHYPAIALPRAGLSTFRSPEHLHPRSCIETFFYDRWNLSSTTIRHWLQLYRIPHPLIHNSTTEQLVLAALPGAVKDYIERNNLYMAETPFFRLRSKISTSDRVIVPSHNPSSHIYAPLQGVLITAGCRKRLQAIRPRLAQLNIPISEQLGIDGSRIDVHLVQGKMYITEGGSYLCISKGFLYHVIVPNAQAVIIAPSIAYPLSNFEVACTLSHYKLWVEAFWRGNTHTLVLEDRAILPLHLDDRICALLRTLEEQQYSLCYLVSSNEVGIEADAPKLRAVTESDLVLTAYLVSRKGLQMLLGDAFPIREPVDWYVKRTLCRNHRRMEKVFGIDLIQRNTSFTTTIPKLKHSW